MHSFIAVGPPWLGAPRALRCVVRVTVAESLLFRFDAYLRNETTLLILRLCTAEWREARSRDVSAGPRGDPIC